MRLWLNGIRGRIVLVVFAVTACLYSALGTIGFIQIANGGRNEIRERVNEVIDQFRSGLELGSKAVTLATADGVSVRVVAPSGTSAPASPGVIVVRREVSVGGRPVTLVGSASDARLTESMRSLHHNMWIGIPFAVLLTTAVAALAVRRTLAPVSEITRFAGSVAHDKTAARVEVPDTDDEIQELAVTINEMLDRIEEGQIQQRQFTSDAAHELRTPLMAIQGEIELALRHHESIDESLVRRLETLAARLGSRVEDLVLLSSLDEHAPLRPDRVAIDDIIEAEAAIVRAHITERSEHDVVVEADRRLLTRAIANLLANARRHATSSVEVAVLTSPGLVEVHVDDDGPGVPPDKVSTIFQRFGRLEESRSDPGSPGLGLAIVASVAAAHGGEISVSRSPLGGARFTLTLPR